MGILRKYNEFLESPEMQAMGSEEETVQPETSSDDLKKALDELEREGGTVDYKNYKITLPSEINYEGKPKTYLIDKGGKHVQAQSQAEVEEIVTEQVLFESFRSKQRRRK
jgi:hypothetical protein